MDPQIAKLIDEGRRRLTAAVEQEQAEEAAEQRAAKTARAAANDELYQAALLSLPEFLRPYLVRPDNPTHILKTGECATTLQVDDLAPIRFWMHRPSAQETWKPFDLDAYAVGVPQLLVHSAPTLAWSADYTGHQGADNLEEALALAQTHALAWRTYQDCLPAINHAFNAWLGELGNLADSAVAEKLSAQVRERLSAQKQADPH